MALQVKVDYSGETFGLLYTVGDVWSPIERANTGVADVLFLVLKSYECTAHQLFRGKTDHGRVIERNKVRFLYSGSDFIHFGKPTKSQTVRRVDAL